LIGTFALRAAPRRQTARRAATRTSSRPKRAVARSRVGARRRVSVDASARLFVLSAGVLASAFLTALLYLRFATSIAASGYDLHDLRARRDELTRQNQLLQLQLDRLDAPARIEAEAKRLGLVKAAQTVFLNAGSSVTLR
jgi:hypothetical protein